MRLFTQHTCTKLKIYSFETATYSHHRNGAVVIGVHAGDQHIGGILSCETHREKVTYTQVEIDITAVILWLSAAACQLTALKASVRARQIRYGDACVPQQVDVVTWV